MKQHRAADAVCRRYCAYFKPSSPEDLACKGYSVAQQLIGQGVIRFSDEEPMPGDWLPQEALAAELGKTLCAACPFQEEDCDFSADVRARVPLAAAKKACGGFLFLARMIEQGIVGTEELCRAVQV